ncbi:DNA polymerase alpha/epsilon subunit B-domain-containing protein [Chytridium lagenaria]|nr:DNA polymerase alpha/epsilon subunit B-domain-containing protein [Chytridium lagenaria]
MLAVRKTIVQILSKKYGLTLKADAAAFLEATFSSPDIGRDELITEIDEIATAYLKLHGSKGLFVDKESLQSTFDLLSNGDFGMGEDEHSHMPQDLSVYVSVISAFDGPCWRYVPESRRVERVLAKPSLLSDARNKIAYMQMRMHIVRQSLLRNKNFKVAFQQSRQSSAFELSSIKSLSGRNDSSFFLFGMLTQMEEGKYHLEDGEGWIELDFSGHVQQTVGLFTQNCFVLVEGGINHDQTFRVQTICMPPCEKRETTMSVFGQVFDQMYDSFMRLDDQKTLREIELNSTDATIVIVSDVHLDSPKVLSKLRVLFEGYSTAILPLVFVFVGDFSNSTFFPNAESLQTYKDGFDSLASIIARYPSIARSRFVFIPGPNDPWIGNILPRPPIPKNLIARFQTVVPKSEFTSNPCRIRYCMQEMVIFRENMMSKMRRNTILSPDMAQEPDMAKHLIKTICDQSFLTPLPISTSPIYWNFAHAMTLYPLPHSLILADVYDPYAHSYENCVVINPGSFSTRSSFAVWSPADKTGEVCYV